MQNSWLVNAGVALRKESVDRNKRTMMTTLQALLSLSARRAWIEIRNSIKRCLMSVVALRKESVDRNLIGGVNRAIDIVALRKESVDRNANFMLNA